MTRDIAARSIAVILLAVGVPPLVEPAYPLDPPRDQAVDLASHCLEHIDQTGASQSPAM